MGTLIAKNQVKQKHDEIMRELDRLESLPIITYKTENKYIEKCGHITQLDSMVKIAKAHKIVIEHFSGLSYSAIVLGITDDELADDEIQTYLGFTKESWEDDFRSRVEELRRRDQRAALYRARKLLKKNFSEDDKFAADMEKLDTILKKSGVSINPTQVPTEQSIDFLDGGPL